MTRRVTQLVTSLTTAVVFMTASSIAYGRDLVCRSSGYCVNDLTCSTSGAGEELSVTLKKGNRVEFGWSPDVRFSAPGVRKERFTIYISNDVPTSTQVFVLADDMTATMGVTTYLTGKLYNSDHALVCEDVR